MPEHHHSKVLIIGSGAAGFTAAVYAARANLMPILVRGLQPGGQLTITTDVENYPGFAEAVQGPWLMEQMYEQAKNVGTEMFEDTIVSADLSKRPFEAIGDSGDFYSGDTLIIATGASARWLGLDSEQKFMGFGVSACATCDGFFFREKLVAVIGGGNTAVEEALFLTKFASKVFLIHRRDELRAEKILQDRLFRNDKITPVWNSVLDAVIGDDDPPGVTAVRVRNVKIDEVTEIPIDGVFIAIGHDPNTQLFRSQLEMDCDGYIITAPDSTVTSVPGVYAAGDVQDKIYRQAVTAAGTGCMSALEAERFLTTQTEAAEAAE
ncbi:MAG: Thioredoxin reductase [Alphaproteobacteria bacterium MarineAlpha3_Bin4]|nr:thioredoxin-disulfide reductase [Pseudomonadota bacterium]PPR76084.1 MAG: Thioredoxin reductase [Alphaproteobacteria bacterium MarineAlpha3_Bin4]